MTSVLAICGSLRRASLNRRLLEAASGLSPAGLHWTAYTELRALPPYDQDLDTAAEPAPVARLRAAVRAADALVIATPEYNGSLPGVLKNALDWASRPRRDAALSGKRIALMTATVSDRRGAAALRDGARVLTHMGNRVVLPPGVLVAGAAGALAGGGGAERLTDRWAAELIRRQLRALTEGG